MVDPDANLFKYAIHEGHVAYHRSASASANNKTCAYIGHMRNAYGTRVTNLDNMDQAVRDWHWPLGTFVSDAVHTKRSLRV